MSAPGKPGPQGLVLNAYYLQEEAALALRRGEALCAVVEEVFTKARALGASGVRTNAFNDDPARVGTSALQVGPGEYDALSLRALDLVLSRAQAHGLGLVLTLGNHWDDYGGARQYVAWAGLPSPRTGDPRFYVERRVVDAYRAHVRWLLQRESSLDGRRLGEHPAVLAFELLNEPRGTGLDRSGAALRGWIDAVGAEVKQWAPAKALGSGEEGLETPGTSFALNSASPVLDLASAHVYPQDWRWRPGRLARRACRFIEARARVARGLGKSLFLGEVGARGCTQPGRAGAAARSLLGAMVACAAREGIAIAPWIFAPDARPDGDGYALRWLNGTEPSDPRNGLAALLGNARLA